MTEKQKEAYIAWLNDAHALEESLVDVLEKQIEDAKGQPNAVERLTEHLNETKRHAELVRSCLLRHDEEPSTSKDLMAKTSAMLSGLMTSFSGDTMVKNVHSSYAAEHSEIATYTLIMAAAAELGDSETVAVCNEILEDEERMADWLIDQLPEVTVKHLAEVTKGE